jgi:hypothetical protein
MFPRAQIRGRPMPSDRQRRRAILFTTGIVCTSISTGCLTSSFTRRATDPNSEPPVVANDAPNERRDVQNRAYTGRTDASVRSASVQASDVPLAGASLATPFLTAPGPSSPAPAGAFPLELQAVPGESIGKVTPKKAEPSPAAPSTEQPPRASTPLLDAAIQRVTEISRQQREEIASSPTPNATQEPKRPRVPSLISTTQSLVAESASTNRFKANDDVIPLPQQLSRTVEDDLLKGPTRFQEGTPHRKAEDQATKREDRAPGTTGSDSGPRARREHRTAEMADEDFAATRTARSGARAALSAEQSAPSPTPSTETGQRAQAAKLPIGPKVIEESPNPAATDEPVVSVDGRESTPVDGGLIGISDLRLCRSIAGFGSFEPLADERVKAGQRLLVYCELTGLQYEVRDAGFVSRISSRVELKSAPGGPVIWEQELGDAEDACRRRRRDYYVNYFVDLPKALHPGSYRLRLLQTDLVAGSATSSEIPLEVVTD